MLTFGSLFSGIGGLDLGLVRAGWKSGWMVEIDEFCQRVLKSKFPDVPLHGDVKECGAANLSTTRRRDTPVAILLNPAPCARCWATGSWEAEIPRLAKNIPERRNRLRALGNAVVPQAAEWLGWRIRTRLYLFEQS